MTFRPRFFLRSLLPSFLTTTLAVALPSAVTLIFAPRSYAGATDAGVADLATERYATYLEATASAMAIVAATEIVMLTIIVAGLSFVRVRQRGRYARGARAAIEHLVLAALVTASYFGFAAMWHPGLFLSTLSGSVITQAWCIVSVLLFPAILFLSAMGYVAYFAHARWKQRAATLVLVGGMSWGVGHVVVVSRERPIVPFATDGKFKKLEHYSTGRTARKTNILWIAVDSLRPDMIDPTNTPNISALVGASTYFPNTLVTVPRTGPSWAASLTGTSPLTNHIETMFPDSSISDLSDIALPKELASRGFRTGVYSEYAGEFFGRVDLGFQVESVPTVELKQITAQILLSRAPIVLAHAGVWYGAEAAIRHDLPAPLEMLLRGTASFAHPSVLAEDIESTIALDHAERGKPQPFFSLVFYSQPHFPYTSSWPYYAKGHIFGSSSEIAFGRDVANETPIASETDHKQLVALYKSALAETDAAVGELVAKMRTLGTWDDTIVILTADHGEGLYDCDTCVGHGDNLRGMYTLRVPLAVLLPHSQYPRSLPSVDTRWVSQLDIYPTLLSVLSMDPIAIHEGHALLDSEGVPTTDIPERTFFAETGEWLWETPAVPKDRLSYPPITGMAMLEHDRIVIDPKYMPVVRAAKERAAIRPPYKLVYQPGAESASFRLYRIDSDPNEEHDISKNEPDVAAWLKRELFQDIFRHEELLPVDDYIVTRPKPPPAENW